MNKLVTLFLSPLIPAICFAQHESSGSVFSLISDDFFQQIILRYTTQILRWSVSNT